MWHLKLLYPAAKGSESETAVAGMIVAELRATDAPRPERIEETLRALAEPAAAMQTDA